MNKKEVKRLKTMELVLRGEITQREAGKMLRITDRHVRKIKKKIEREGDRGVIHKLRGKPSNNKITEELRERVKEIINRKYEDFKPLLATEHLYTDDKIKLSSETVRKIMIEGKIWKGRKRKEKHREWRERRSCLGELVQLDGSTHDWFEGRGSKCVLIAYIDDATSKILHGKFVDSETTMNLMMTTKEYIKKNGIAIAYYVDNDGIYKVNRSKAEKKYEEETITQFGRALEELGTDLIFAESAEAKGRVERLFSTMQDRLVKEMRLKNINSIASGNKYLEEIFIPFFNERYSVSAKNPINMHRKLLRGQDLDKILSKQIPMVINKDFTVRYNNQFYQIEENQQIKVYSKQTVIMEKRIDGTDRMIYKGKYINFHKINKKPYKPKYGIYPRDHKSFWNDKVFAQHSNSVRI